MNTVEIQPAIIDILSFEKNILISAADGSERCSAVFCFVSCLVEALTIFGRGRIEAHL